MATFKVNGVVTKYSSSVNKTDVIITAPGNNFKVNDFITLRNSNVPELNGTFRIFAIDKDSFNIVLPFGPITAPNTTNMFASSIAELTITPRIFKEEERAMAYLYGLSDFWVTIFSGGEKIDDVLEVETVQSSDIYSRFLQLSSTISLSEISTTIKSQLKLVVLDSSSLVTGTTTTYELPERILSAKFIMNRPLLPTLTLEEGIHYDINPDGTRITLYDTLENLNFPLRRTSDGTNEFSLWFTDVEIDKDLVYNHFGKLIGVDKATSTENYKNFIFGLYYLYTRGPNLELLRKGLNLVLGLPLARDIETVIDIRPYLETNQSLVITDLNQYVIPYGVEPIVAIGDVLVPSQEIARWVEVKDWISDGKWWLNLYIPSKIIPHIPSGQTDRYAKEGSYVDELMLSHLKTHTFLVNVNVTSFKDVQNFTDLFSLIMDTRPTYTSPVYIWTVPLEETVNIEETFSQIQILSQRCDNISTPINLMNRNEMEGRRLFRGCPQFIRYNVPNRIDELMGGSPYINGATRFLHGEEEDSWYRYVRFLSNYSYDARDVRNHSTFVVGNGFISNGAIDLSENALVPNSTYVLVPRTEDITLTRGDFVIEGYNTVTTRFNNNLFDCVDTSGNGIKIESNAFGQMILYLYSSATSGIVGLVIHQEGLPFNEKFHWAVVRSGSRLFTYINGVRSLAVFNWSGDIFFGGSLRIGYGFKGLIHAFRITRGSDRSYNKFTINPSPDPFPLPVSGTDPHLADVTFLSNYQEGPEDIRGNPVQFEGTARIYNDALETNGGLVGGSTNLDVDGGDAFTTGGELDGGTSGTTGLIDINAGAAVNTGGGAGGGLGLLNGSYLTIPNTLAFSFGTRDFTIEMSLSSNDEDDLNDRFLEAGDVVFRMGVGPNRFVSINGNVTSLSFPSRRDPVYLAVSKSGTTYTLNVDGNVTIFGGSASVNTEGVPLTAKLGEELIGEIQSIRVTLYARDISIIPDMDGFNFPEPVQQVKKISGYINHMYQYQREGQPIEDKAWVRTMFHRGQQTARFKKSLIKFDTNPVYTDDSGIGIKSHLYATNGYRVIPLYIISRADLEIKMALTRLPAVGKNKWYVPIFKPIPTQPFINQVAFNAERLIDLSENLRTNFSLFFDASLKTARPGQFIPDRVVSYATEGITVGDIHNFDYLMAIRIYENTFGLYWITRNQDIEIKPYIPVDESGGLTITTNGSKISRGMGPLGSPYYLLRGAGIEHSGSSFEEIINGDITNASQAYTTFRDSNTSPVKIITRGGVVIDNRKDLT